MSNFSDFISSMSFVTAIISGLIFAVIFETITIFFRFVLKMQSTRDTAKLAKFTFGYRIHHGYMGIIMIFVSFFLSSTFWINSLIIVGIGLFLSDLIHHFIILKSINGDTEFHIRYDDYFQDN